MLKAKAPIRVVGSGGLDLIAVGTGENQLYLLRCPACGVERWLVPVPGVTEMTMEHEADCAWHRAADGRGK